MSKIQLVRTEEFVKDFITNATIIFLKPLRYYVSLRIIDLNFLNILMVQNSAKFLYLKKIKV